MSLERWPHRTPGARARGHPAAPRAGERRPYTSPDALLRLLVRAVAMSKVRAAVVELLGSPWTTAAVSLVAGVLGWQGVPVAQAARTTAGCACILVVVGEQTQSRLPADKSRTFILSPSDLHILLCKQRCSRPPRCSLLLRRPTLPRRPPPVLIPHSPTPTAGVTPRPGLRRRRLLCAILTQLLRCLRWYPAHFLHACCT